MTAGVRFVAAALPGGVVQRIAEAVVQQGAAAEPVAGVPA